MSRKPQRDIEKVYSTAEFVAKLRRLADAVEKGERFEIQIAGERVYVPVRARFNIEHELDGGEEEIEFQIRWTWPTGDSHSIRRMRGISKGFRPTLCVRRIGCESCGRRSWSSSWRLCPQTPGISRFEPAAQ